MSVGVLDDGRLRGRPRLLNGWRGSRGFDIWAATFMALIPALWLLLHGQFNILASGLFLVVFCVTLIVDAKLAVLLVFAYLFMLGDVRRFVGSFVGFPKLDTLLLVGPTLTAILVIPILLQLRLKDLLSKMVLALTVIMVLEVFNPRQGGVAVGLGGALSYLVPLLWFWIGQKYGSAQLLSTFIYRVLIPLAIIAALLGLYQTYVGFLPWEKDWISAVSAHYTSLNIGGNIRPFGYFVSPAEYTNFLLLATVCSATAIASRKRLMALWLPLVGTSLFLAASRGAIFRLLLALAVAWALGGKRGRGWAYRLPLGLAVGGGALVLALSSAGGGGGAAGGHLSSSQASTQHQVEGLSHPLDKKYSTLGVHAAEFTGGIGTAFAYPIGNGLGSTTLGARQFGSQGDVSGGTEVDLGDVFLTSGIIGGFLYLAVMVLVCQRAIGFAREAPKEVGLSVPAMLASLGGVWLLTGQYSVVPLTWFLVGAMTFTPVKSSSVANAKR